VTISVSPSDWPLATPLSDVLEAAVARLELTDRLERCDLVVDAIAADDRAWFRLDRSGQKWAVTIWLHPDQVLQDRPDSANSAPVPVWHMEPAPTSVPDPTLDDFSPPNAQRFVYQQLQLVADVIDGRLVPHEVPPSLVEAFQEAWLVTVDGRLQEQGLPHLSAAERRTSFLRRFGPAGILTPNHWSIFNALWNGDLADQKSVLAKVRLLPSLGRLRRE
jgi:hypothetical protein